MKRALTLIFCLLAALVPPAHAQPKRAIGKAAQAAAKTAQAARADALRNVRQIAASSRVERALHKAVSRKTPPPAKRLKLVESMLAPNTQFRVSLIKLQAIQRKYGALDFFELFATAYYERRFGPVTPDIKAFFLRMNEIDDPNAQRKMLERLETLAANKNNYLKYVWPDAENHILRVKYLPGVEALSRDKSFNPAKLAYAYEIQVPPGEFIPLAPGKEISTFNLEGTDWHIAGFAAGLDYLPELYRFLVTDGRFGASYRVIWDKPGKALLVSSASGRVQVRVSQHEYGKLHRLHLHVNRRLTVRFPDAQGKQITEPTLLNISFPVEAQTPNPRVPMQDWFITFPAKKFLKDPNASVRLGKIF